MIRSISNNIPTIDALERLRLAIGEITDQVDAYIVLSVGASRIKRLTEENERLKAEIKIVNEKNQALVRQQREQEKHNRDYIDWGADR